MVTGVWRWKGGVEGVVEALEGGVTALEVGAEEEQERE